MSLIKSNIEQSSGEPRGETRSKGLLIAAPSTNENAPKPGKQYRPISAYDGTWTMEDIKKLHGQLSVPSAAKPPAGNTPEKVPKDPRMQVTSRCYQPATKGRKRSTLVTLAMMPIAFATGRQPQAASPRPWLAVTF